MDSNPQWLSSNDGRGKYRKTRS